MRNHIESGLRTLQNTSSANYKKFSTIIVLIEEPENNFHPELQKMIPNFLQEIVKKFQAQFLDQNLVFLISTHSPFVIGAASNFLTQKVYLFEDGHLLGLYGNPIYTSSGYNASECSWLVG